MALLLYLCRGRQADSPIFADHHCAIGAPKSGQSPLLRNHSSALYFGDCLANDFFDRRDAAIDLLQAGLAQGDHACLQRHVASFSPDAPWLIRSRSWSLIGMYSNKPVRPRKPVLLQAAQPRP